MKWMKLFIILLCVNPFGTSAKGVNIDTIFANMPENICPLLQREQKLDLLDLYNANRRAQVDNVLEGASTLISKTDSTFSLQVSAASRYEAKLLYTPTDTIIAFCKTMGVAPSLESQMNFYSIHWTPLLSPKGYVEPHAEDFSRNVDSLSNLISMQPAKMMEIRMEPDGIAFYLSVGLFNKSDAASLSTSLQPIKLVWRRETGEFVKLSIQK